VGTPRTLYFFITASFFFLSALSLLGMSKTTRTKFFWAPLTKEFFEKTFLCIMMQGGHQSEPVNSTKTCLCSFFACLTPSSILVSQSFSAAWTKEILRRNNPQRSEPILMRNVFMFFIQ